LVAISFPYQHGSFEEAETSFRSQIKVLEDDLARQKVCAIIAFSERGLTAIYSG